MTEPTIRQIATKEMLQAVYPLTSYAVHPSPPLPDREEWKERVTHRKGVACFAAYEGETSVACAATSPLTQNVRGALYKMGGVWGVATHPAARRRGYSRQLLVRLLSEMRQAGQCLSALYPFRESFYERLGYVTLPHIHKITFAPSTLAPLLKTDLEGEIEIVQSRDRHDAYQAYVQRMQQRTHGMATFDFVDPSLVQRQHSWLALAVVNGAVEGLMVYRLTGELPTQFTLNASRFYYSTSRAKYLLLQWIARHIDQAQQVELWLPAYERPETWLSDMNVERDRATFTPMGRVVDVARIGGMQTGRGQISVRVVDPQCSWNEDVWRLETANGRLRVRPGRAVDCELTIQGLSALIYGAHDPDDLSVRGWGDPSAEALATMRTMFPLKLAYLHEWF